LQKRGVKTFVRRGERLPYEDKKFDYGALIITLCFVEEPKGV
jgi:hypothetical protein